MSVRAGFVVALLIAVAALAWTDGNRRGYASGYHAADASASTRIDAADARAADATTALTLVQRTLDDARRNYRLAMQAADETIAARDADIARLQRGLQFKLTEIRHDAKKWEDCEALARDPVCGPVAQRLWPDTDTDGNPSD